MDYNISIYLDKRSQLKDGTRPLKLRVYNSIVQRAKFYKLNLSLAEVDFISVMDDTQNVRGQRREMRIILRDIENRGHAIAKELDPFSFYEFERRMFRNKGSSNLIKYHYDEKINRLKGNGQYSTANNYELSFKSISKYLKERTNLSPEDLTFYDVNPQFLNGYESFMLNKLKRSRNTVSIYLRGLRSIFNDAIESNDIKDEVYPFGKGKGRYQIPNSTGNKSALDREQLAVLFTSTPRTPDQERAKDFWFFSYACNGMNIKDIAQLKVRDVKGDHLNFLRAKTINTKKSNLVPITVYLNDYAQSIIAKYRTGQRPDDYLFNILDPSIDIEKRQKVIKNFTRFINQHIKKLADWAGLGTDLSVQWARHSFATNSIRRGASMEFISEALNHSNLKTTKNYFAGFEDEKKKEFANNLMDF